MNRPCYDFVCGLGSACIASQALRDAGLQYASFPFDWLSGPTFRQRIDTIVSDFSGWFEKDDLVCVGNPNRFTHDSYFNRRTGATFPHDFDFGVPFDDMYARVREKYRRRIDRMYRLIRGSRRVLVVWLENPVDDDRPCADDVAYARSALSAKFPGVGFDFLVIDRAADGQANGVPACEGGVWRVSCGYRRKTLPGGNARPWDLEVGPICAILSHFSAKDYRSAGERRRHAAAERAKRYSRYGAANWLEYCWVKLQFKACKHLAKKVSAWGGGRHA